jgi:8-oxo-dGTP diphosphatase
MIDVCCAIIADDDKILAVQRGPESSHPLKWEFPGGKIQDGETAEECIVREIEEELTIGINIVNQLDAVEFDYGTKQIKLIPFVCRIKNGQIVLTEHVAKCWFNPNDWQSIDWSAADYELILKNSDRLKKLVG